MSKKEVMVKLSQASLFKNRAKLTEGALRGLRSHLLDILEAGVRRGDPGRGTREKLKLNGDHLLIDGVDYDLKQYRHIYLVGSGKGSFPIAQALEEILGDRLERGVLVVKRGEERKLTRVEVLQAGHPLPDQDSLEGAKRVLALADQAGPDDMVLTAITGGSSSLTTLPPPGLDLADIKQVGDLLLKSGAVIREVNVVRRHLCQLKGGQLAKRIQPAMAVTFTLDTAPEGMPWPDMCLPDPTSFAEAIQVLKDHGLWERTTPAVKRHLEQGLLHPEWDTVKNFAGMRTQMVTVGDPISMCQAAADMAEQLGYQPVIIASDLEGEAREAGILLAGIAKEILLRQRPFTPPCALISGGETTVTINGGSGQGGPNQEFVLGFAAKASSHGLWACASMDSDGTDGPTEIAGGMVDGETLGKAQAAGIDLAHVLREHDSSRALGLLNGALKTGHTGTNLQNLRVLLIPQQVD